MQEFIVTADCFIVIQVVLRDEWSMSEERPDVTSS